MASPSLRTAWLGVTALCGGLALAAPARAADGEWHAGGRAGFAALSKAGLGPALGLHGAYGLNDVFDVTLEALGSRHAGADGTDVLSASAGLTYKIDVFEWIPYVALLGGYYQYAGRPGPHGEHGSVAGASVQLGVDYMLMRELAIGAELRWHASFSDGVNVPLFGATLGAEYRWGF